jgi:uncharacterized coiled-coil protein SlyX
MGETDGRFDLSETALAALYAAEPAATSQPGAHLDDLLHRFYAAAENQSRAHSNLNDRIDRLESGESATELRQAVRELHLGLSGLASETVRNITRIDERIGVIAEAMKSLSETMAASNNAFKHLSLSAHDKIAALEASLAAAETRIAASDKDAAELKSNQSQLVAALGALSQKCEKLEARLAAGLPECESRLATLSKRLIELGSQTSFGMGTLSEKLAALGGTLNEKQTAGAQIDERLKLAERRLAELAQCESKIHELAGQTADLDHLERAVRELRGQGDQMSSDLCSLSEGMRSLADNVNLTHAEAGHLKDRLGRAETSIAASLDQTETLVKLHHRLSDAFREN